MRAKRLQPALVNSVYAYVYVSVEAITQYTVENVGGNYFGLAFNRMDTDSIRILKSGIRASLKRRPCYFLLL